MRRNARGRWYAWVAGAAITAVLVTGAAPGPTTPTTPWVMHIIQGGTSGVGNFDGSDGVDLADVDDDGDLDVVSGHEQGRVVSVSFNPTINLDPDPDPDPGGIGDPWKTISLPVSPDRIVGPEDAVFADVDSDGAMDVIVAAQGGLLVSVLFGPDLASDANDATAWRKINIQESVLRQEAAMRVQFADMNGDNRKDILVGAREFNRPANLGFYTATDPRDPASWHFKLISPVGWVMQMLPVDMNDDGLTDVLYSDRESIALQGIDNTRRGVRWMENLGGETPTWMPHPITPAEAAHKWFSYVDWNGDGRRDVIDCRSDATNPTVQAVSIWLQGTGPDSWTKLAVPVPEGVGQCQQATAAEIDGDGTSAGLDLGISYSQAEALSGVIWMKNTGTVAAPIWERNEVSGSALGTKYDNLIWNDLDGDGDLDALTSEQHEGSDQTGPGLGVIWYQNPTN